MTARYSLLATVLVLAGAAAFFLSRRPTPGELAVGSAPRVADAVSRGPAARAAAGEAPTNPSLAAAVERTQRPAPSVRVKATQSVASVNGVTVTGRDLLAFRAKVLTEQEMTAEMYASLRDRAIDRELTFQEARKAGLELTPVQRKQLEQVGENARKRGETDPAQLDFEEVDARAHMLATALLEQYGLRPPFASDDDVKAYYDSHPDEFDELPADPVARDAAWKKLALQIRQTLAIELQEKYQQQVRQYFEQLRAAAKITD